MAMQGRPHTIFSDKGTNLVGAARQIRETASQ